MMETMLSGRPTCTTSIEWRPDPDSDEDASHILHMRFDRSTQLIFKMARKHNPESQACKEQLHRHGLFLKLAGKSEAFVFKLAAAMCCPPSCLCLSGQAWIGGPPQPQDLRGKSLRARGVAHTSILGYVYMHVCFGFEP